MREMIVDDAQLFAREMSIDVRSSLIHRQMRAVLDRFFKHLRSQIEERRIAGADRLNLRPADLTRAEMVGYFKHIRSG